MNLKNLSLGKKFFLGFGSLVILLIVITLISINGFRGVLNSSNQSIDSDDLRAELLQNYNLHLLWSKQLSQSIYAEQENRITVEMNHTLCAFGKWYYSDARLDAETLIPSLAPILERMEDPHKQLHQTATSIKNALENPDYEDYSEALSEARNIYQIETLTHLDVMGDLFTEAIKVADERSNAAHADVYDTANSVQLITLLIALAALLLAIIVAVAISRSILNNVRKGIEYANEVAQGNLKAKLEINAKDEVGLLLASFEETVEKIKDIVIKVSDGSDNMSSASEQLSSTSQEMSQSSNEQAASVEEVSSSMEQMAANIQQNSDNATQTEKIAFSAENGMQKVERTASESLISVKEIADKITIISDIAFQTNLLALNAAVEAARAGEHGRGFAVVATEVRKLAERSKVAAEEINILSKKTVSTTEDATNLVKNLLPEINRTAKLVQEISAASAEQTSGTDQINTAIQQLNQATQQNAASSEEVATSAEELSAQADQLREVINYFKVDREYNGDNFMKNKSQLVVNRPKDTTSKQQRISNNGSNSSHLTNGKNGKSANSFNGNGFENNQSKKDGVKLNLSKSSSDDSYERY
ncbi:MAG: methyl-accepting chemotaxis protein [Bacteroidales bacterium]